MEDNYNVSGQDGSSVAKPDVADATAEDIRKAKELLRANGYWLVAYRETGEKAKRAVGSGVDFVTGKCKAFGGWLSAKRDELKARQEERSRVAAEKSQTAGSDDAPKCVACGAVLVPGARFCRKCGKPVAAVQGTPNAEPAAVAKTTGASVGDSAEPAAPKCASCGTALLPGMKFCGECGTPVNAGVRDPCGRETACRLNGNQDSVE